MSRDRWFLRLFYFSDAFIERREKNVAIEIHRSASRYGGGRLYQSLNGLKVVRQLTAVYLPLTERTQTRILLKALVDRTVE